MVNFSRINSGKGRMGVGSYSIKIYRTEPNGFLQVIPSDSVGLLLGVTIPGGQHGRNLEHQLTKFAPLDS